jgi:hypothetical protein
MQIDAISIEELDLLSVTFRLLCRVLLTSVQVQNSLQRSNLIERMAQYRRTVREDVGRS